VRTLNADFARPAHWPVVVLWVVAVAVFALAGEIGARDFRAWQALSLARVKTAELEARLDTESAAQAAQAVHATRPPSFAPDARHWMKLSAFDAGRVLRSVESAQVAGAKLVSIEIDGDSQRVELEVEVTGADVASSYLQALNAGIERPAWALSRLQIQGGTELALIHGQIE
jgi:hypothetical protein